jgi:hypothetical protein
MTKEFIQVLKENYPSGTRLQLVSMNDPDGVEPGTKGTVRYVDDMGTIHMQWDNGRTLGLIYDEDDFITIVEA